MRTKLRKLYDYLGLEVDKYDGQVGRTWKLDGELQRIFNSCRSVNEITNEKLDALLRYLKLEYVPKDTQEVPPKIKKISKKKK